MTSSLIADIRSQIKECLSGYFDPLQSEKHMEKYWQMINITRVKGHEILPKECYLCCVKWGGVFFLLIPYSLELNFHQN